MRRILYIVVIGLVALAVGFAAAYRQGLLGPAPSPTPETATNHAPEAPPESALPSQIAKDLAEKNSAAASGPSGPNEQAARNEAPANPTANPAAKGDIAPSFDVVRIDPQGNAVIAGRAAPNADVTILDKGKEIGHTRADENGEWVWVPDAPLKPGSLELGLSAQADGKPPIESKSTVVLVVPEPNKDIAGREGGKASGALVLKVPNQGGVSEVVQAPSAEGSPSDVQLGRLALDVIDYDESGKLALGGRAKPGAHLRVYLDNGLLGETTANDTGRWELRPDNPVAPGTYRLRVDEMDNQGKVTARIELPFARSEKVAGGPGTSSIIVQPGNSLWRIARHSYGSGLQYTVIYQANKDQIRDPDLIYPGQVFNLPAQ